MLFGFVYEQFSHGVNSNYMWFAWVWPLGFGVVPYLVFYFVPIKRVPGSLSECFYNLGVAFLTTRSLFLGVLEIYGKTNVKMTLVYSVLTIIFLVTGVVLYSFGLFSKKEETKE